MNTCTSLIAEGVEEPGLEDFRAGWEAKSEKLGNVGVGGGGKVFGRKISSAFDVVRVIWQGDNLWVVNSRK